MKRLLILTILILLLPTISASAKGCMLCGSDKSILMHEGTRDRNDINVQKCAKCGLVFLSNFKHITETFYQDSGMRDFDVNFNFEESLKQTRRDDLRRANDLREIYRDKTVLDFGCGNGGFLYFAKPYSKSVCGVELEKVTRQQLNARGLRVKKNINNFNFSPEVVTMFHVIEHLTNPTQILKQIYNKMNFGAKLIIETPNANDALLSLYGSEEFANFTYWSPHVYLYTSKTLETLLTKAGFKIVWNKQIQRYPLSNHLYWLSQGKPGGHEKWEEFNIDSLNSEYTKILESKKMCDSLLICVEK